jgi:hypothetical protein
LVAGVDEPVEEGLGDDGSGKKGSVRLVAQRVRGQEGRQPGTCVAYVRRSGGRPIASPQQRPPSKGTRCTGAHQGTTCKFLLSASTSPFPAPKRPSRERPGDTTHWSSPGHNPTRRVGPALSTLLMLLTVFGPVSMHLYSSLTSEGSHLRDTVHPDRLSDRTRCRQIIAGPPGSTRTPAPLVLTRTTRLEGRQERLRGTWRCPRTAAEPDALSARASHERQDCRARPGDDPGAHHARLPGNDRNRRSGKFARHAT